MTLDTPTQGCDTEYMSIGNGEATFTQRARGFLVRIVTDDRVILFDHLGDLESAIRTVRGLGYLTF